MARNVIGLFRDTNEAQAAIQDLESAGFSREHLNVIAYDGSAADSEGNELGENTAKGAAAGGVAGLLLGLAAMAIPGVGPIIAAGPIVAALAGAGVGAATGGILGALSDMGVPGHEAKYYHEAVRHGGTLIIVPTEAEHIAQDILDRHGAVDPTEGWKPDDPHSDAPNFGDEGGSSQWSHVALTASERKPQSRVYPDKRDKSSVRS